MNFKFLGGLFLFTRKERNGILVLLLILLLFISLNFALPYLLPDKKYDVAAWSREVERQRSTIAIPIEEIAENFEGVLDPNLVTLQDLLKMGLPVKIAAGWIKYLEHGGHFRKKEEVMKIYGMTPMFYEKVKSHLNLKTTTPSNKTKYQPIQAPQKVDWKASAKEDDKVRKPVEKRIQLVELNKADSIALESLPGIGPVLASRIIKYRNLLGGYYEVGQLKEIYGMSEEFYVKSANYFLTDTLGIRKIDLNFLSVSEMGRHPYIGFRQAKRVVKRRDQMGKFEGISEIKALFTADSLRRLLPYLLVTGTGR